MMSEVSSAQEQAPVVIVGSGLAAFTVARELRKLNPALPVLLVTREAGYFYSKPMLSTALANGKEPDQLVTTPKDAIADQLGIEILARTDVIAIDRQSQCLQTTQGPVAYRVLVLALGADPTRLSLAGDAADRVLSVNDLDDYARFRQAIQGKPRVAILGAGLIGCEFANDLVAAGCQVSVIDLATHALSRLLPAQASNVLQQALAQAGVQWHLGTTVQAVNVSEDELAVTLANSQVVAVDAVLSAVGLSPRVALARAAGLTTARGICVDRYLQTSDPHIFALGDCAEVEGHVLPYVMPIMQAGRALAQTLNGNRTAVSYPAMPVAVKTPAMPTVVLPPAPGAKGQWRISESADAVDARFESEAGQLLGFALLGTATAQRAALAKMSPGLLI